jgi:hypothetical protein
MRRGHNRSASGTGASPVVRGTVGGVKPLYLQIWPSAFCSILLTSRRDDHARTQITIPDITRETPRAGGRECAAERAKME